MQNQESYYWWHRAKRHMVITLIRKFCMSHMQNILDVGCGTGYTLSALSKLGIPYGIDTSEVALSYARKKGLKRVYAVDISKDTVPFKNNFFQLVTCLDVLEHLDNDGEVLKKLRNLLKTSGKLVITAPAYPWFFTYWDTELMHKRRYVRNELLRLCVKSGFRVIYASHFFSFLLPIAVLFRTIKKMIGKDTVSDFVKLPKLIHELLYQVSCIETFVVQKFSVPFGLSLIVVLEAV